MLVFVAMAADVVHYFICSHNDMSNPTRSNASLQQAQSTFGPKRYNLARICRNGYILATFSPSLCMVSIHTHMIVETIPAFRKLVQQARLALYGCHLLINHLLEGLGADLVEFDFCRLVLLVLSKLSSVDPYARVQ